VPVSVRLPKSMAQRIKDENWDLGQFIFNIVSTGRVPIISDDMGSGLVKKLVFLMIENAVVAGEGAFTPAEEHIIRSIAEELQDGT